MEQALGHVQVPSRIEIIITETKHGQARFFICPIVIYTLKLAKNKSMEGQTWQKFILVW